MEKKNCVFENELLNDLRTGHLTPGAKEHAETCAVCRESMAIQRWLKNFQTAGLEQAAKKKLPDAEYLWDKAYGPAISAISSISFAPSPTLPTLVPGKMLEKKALIPLLFFQVLAYVTVILVTIYLFIINFSGIKDLLADKLELPVIFSSLLTIFTVFFKANSYISIPLTLGFTAVIIFTLAEVLEGKNFRSKRQYIF